MCTVYLCNGLNFSQTFYFRPDVIRHIFLEYNYLAVESLVYIIFAGFYE